MMNMEQRPKHSLYPLIIILIFVLFSGIMILSSIDKIKESIEESQMIPLIQAHKRDNDTLTNNRSHTLYYPIISAVDDSYRFTSISVELEHDVDTYHQFIESLLAPLPQGALIEGAVSFIPEGTELIGFTISRSIGYIDLSKEFLNHTTLENGYERRIAQVRKNLMTNFALNDVVILIEGEIFSFE